MRFAALDADGLASALAGERPPFLLDVRSLEDYVAGHVPGARHCPVHELSKRPRELPTSKVARVIVFADTPRRGEAAANFLWMVGYADVAVALGGLTAWRGPLETGPPPPPRAAGPELRIVP